MRDILDDPSPKWEYFENVDIGRLSIVFITENIIFIFSEKNYTGDGIWEIHIQNPVFMEQGNSEISEWALLILLNDIIIF